MTAHPQPRAPRPEGATHLETRAPHPEARELVPGVFWMGKCLVVEYQGTLYHSYDAAFLVCGDDCSMLVETGHPQDLEVIETQLDRLLANGVPPLRYAFTTHTETPHCSGLGRVLERFPDVTAYGALLDLALVYPQFAHRLRPMNPGDVLDLGGTEFRAVEAVIRDLPYTRWGFDTRRRVLFPGDGFAFAHLHEVGHCGSLAEEVVDLDFSEMSGFFAELALYWTTLVDMEPYAQRLEALLDELDVQFIAPTHGLPIGDVKRIFPHIRAGLVASGRRTATSGFVGN